MRVRSCARWKRSSRRCPQRSRAHYFLQAYYVCKVFKSRILASNQPSLPSIPPTHSKPKHSSVPRPKQQIPQTNQVPRKRKQHRDHRHHAHPGRDTQKACAPRSHPKPNEVKSNDTAHSRVDLLLRPVSRQQQRHPVHPQQLGTHSDQVGRRSEKWSRRARGRFDSPEPRQEEERKHPGQRAPGAIIRMRQSEGSQQRPERAEEPANQP